jgi:hypothetical protein
MLEVGMLETLKKPGQYRIDYLNTHLQGNPDALAFYIRSTYSHPAPYCIEAKHHLMAGLCILEDFGLNDRLLGVYIDIDSISIRKHFAFEQLVLDISVGMVKHLFCIHPEELLGIESMRRKLDMLQQKMGTFDVLCYNDLVSSRILA